MTVPITFVAESQNMAAERQRWHPWRRRDDRSGGGGVGSGGVGGGRHSIDYV